MIHEPGEICRCMKSRAVNAAIKAAKRSDLSMYPLRHAPEAYTKLLDAWAKTQDC